MYKRQAINHADSTTRDELITKAIDENLKRHQELWAQGKVQSYDNHDLAYVYDVLKDDGDSATVGSLLGNPSGGTEQQSLYESLRHAEKAEGAGMPYTQEQLERVINHLVEMMAQSHIRCLPDSKREELAPGFDPKSPELQQADFNPMG